MLAAVEFDDQASFPANKVDVIPINRRLADKFKAAELPAANVRPQCEFCWRGCTPQRSRTLSALLVFASQRGNPSA
jgi:hypothetical protein